MESGMLLGGTMVRLLLLPDALMDAKASLLRLFRRYENGIYYSLLRQYTPMEGIGTLYPSLGRRVTDREYFSLVKYAVSLGISHGFTQEAEAAEESFIPPFPMESFPNED